MTLTRYLQKSKNRRRGTRLRIQRGGPLSAFTIGDCDLGRTFDPAPPFDPDGDEFFISFILIMKRIDRTLIGSDWISVIDDDLDDLLV